MIVHNYVNVVSSTSFQTNQLDGEALSEMIGEGLVSAQGPAAKLLK